MSISFNSIPNTVRTPGVYTEVDNSRALQGLTAIPHSALIIGQLLSGGTASADELKTINNDSVADGFFGNGSQLSRMCRIFKQNNPNIELKAIGVSEAGGAKAAGTLSFTLNGSSTSAAGTLYLIVNAKNTYVDVAINTTPTNVTSAIVEKINADSTLPVIASANASNIVGIAAVQSGLLGNDIDFRINYYTGQSTPTTFATVTTTAMANGTAVTPDLDGVWTVIENERFNYICYPFADATNLTSVETELETRFGPLIKKQGHGFTSDRGTLGTITTLGNSRNSQFNSIMGAYDSPSAPPEWAAALCAQAAKNLDQDPARPLQTIKLVGILPPPIENEFTRSERDILLTDGIATYTVVAGNVQIERCITTYQTNAASILDVSYLDVNTLATLGEIRDQFDIRMSNRFITQRYKLADNTFQVQPGQKVATPNSVRAEIISLFTLLRDQGLIENLDDFITNLVVERNASDVNRIDTILPANLVNQFLILASQLQFLL